jgi:hypothetical protein
MREMSRYQEMYQDKDFRGLRYAGVKFWDVHHERWCLFPDRFKEELYQQGVLQEWLPPPPKPVQESLF